MTTPLLLNWLVPEPFPGAGGDVGLFRIIRHLAEFGHTCRVHVVAYELMSEHSTEQVREYVFKHFGPTPAQYYRFTGSIGDADATFATFWPTVENLLTLPNGGRRYYLVQDFEPSFYPHDPHHYERAENTYRAGLHCVTLGPWLAKLLRKHYQATADYFDFAVDTSVYHPRPATRGPRQRVCFYARPATPRRAYETGLAAFQIVKERLPEVEICFFGSNELEPKPPFAATQSGLLGQEELADLFSQSDVGVVFSLSNPSFVPLEMMACGCAALEIASEHWQGVLTHGKDAWLVDATPPAIANGVVELLTNRPLHNRLVENGTRLTAAMDWCNSARQIEAILLRHAPPESERCLARKSTPNESKQLPLDLASLPSRHFEPLRYGLGAWTEHVFFAYDLMAQLLPRTFVELGTDRGESYFAFCQSVLENKTGTQCFAIDHWHGDAHAGSYDETTFKDVTAHNRAHYAPFSALIRSTFDEALDRFAEGSIDLLHIDGHHTEEAVRHDLEAWLPKLRPGGILLLHDIAMRGRDFGVWKVWAELADRGRSWSFAQPPGLGVWEKPPAGERAPLLETLFASPNDLQASLLAYYRQRNADLQETTARQWRDGTIRSAPMASETVIQIFWTSDGIYGEENSTDIRIGHEDWKDVVVKLPAEMPISGLRIDFYSPLTMIEIAAIEVRAEAGALLYRAENTTAFESITLLGDCLRRSLDPFCIEVTGVDPQLHLPPFLRPGRGLEVRLRLRVRVVAS